MKPILSLKFTHASEVVFAFAQQASAGMGGKLRGIGSLLGLGGEGRWPQQIAALEDASGTAVNLVCSVSQVSVRA